MRPAALDTRTPGKLTIGTDNPAYEPWFSDNKPDNGKGFESAVAYQVAERLGYPAANVTWTQVPFNNAIAPGPKAYDFDINQFSITDGAQAGGGLLVAVLPGAADRDHHKGSKIDGGDDDRRPARTPSSAPRSAPPASRRSTS